MKILSISSLIPLPGVLKCNDFVFQTYQQYLQLYEADKVIIFKPVKIDFNILRILRKDTRLIRLKKNHIRRINGFRVVILPYLSAWSARNLHALLTASIFYLNSRKIRIFVKNSGIQVIHAQYVYPDGILAYLLKKKYNIPYFITTHNEKFYFDHFISRFIAKKIFLHATRVIPINHYNYRYFKEIGTPHLRFMPLGFSNKFIRKPKTSSENTVHILTVSVLIKLKNIDKVVLALKELEGKYNIHYTVIGDGPEKDNLMNLVTSLRLNDQISFIAHVPHDKIADEMIKHDIFIMPSYFETFGRVYFEAMAMGIPIICARNSGIHGFFKEREEGLSVDHRDIHDIANALEYLVVDADRRINIGLNGKKLVEQYTWENIATELHNEYSMALKS